MYGNYGKPRKRSLTDLLFDNMGILIALVIVAIISLGLIVPHVTAKTQTLTVTSKWIKQKSGNSGQTYMIGTTDGVYEDADSLAFFKFNSADVYNQLQPHHTYSCETSGFRIPILSANRNIIHCTEVTK